MFDTTATIWLTTRLARGRAFRAAAAALLVVIGLAARVPGDTVAVKAVTVVLSTKASPYRQTGMTLTAELTGRGYAVQTVQLADLAKQWTSPMVRRAYVAVGTQAATWLHSRVTAPGRLIYCMVAHPTRVGLCDTTPRHGVSTDVPLTAQFKLIAQAMPGARSVGMLYRSKNARSTQLLAEVRKALPKTWRLKAVDVDAQRSVARAIDVLFDWDADVVWTAPDTSVYNVAAIRTLLLGGMRRKKAVFGFSPSFVRAGALIGVGVSPKTQGTQAAELTDRVLRAKASPAPNAKSLPTPPKYQVAVNLIVAEKLSITLPRALVKRASYVFQAKNTGGR